MKELIQYDQFFDAETKSNEMLAIKVLNKKLGLNLILHPDPLADYDAYDIDNRVIVEVKARSLEHSLKDYEGLMLQEDKYIRCSEIANKKDLIFLYVSIEVFEEADGQLVKFYVFAPMEHHKELEWGERVQNKTSMYEQEGVQWKVSKLSFDLPKSWATKFNVAIAIESEGYIHYY